MGDLLEFFEKASAENTGSPYDPKYLRAMSFFVPLNSGIQNVYKDIHITQHFSRFQHWRFRPHSMPLAKCQEYGVASIGSEDGRGVKSLQTTRQENIFTGKNIGPPASAWDKIFYGKDKFENNPSGE
jgi:hypothetical protein